MKTKPGMTNAMLGMTLGCFVLILFQYSHVFAQQSPWTEANTKYQSGDFESALASYKNILAAGKETAALDYNLGNAYFRLGHKGKALAFYERALRISPRNEDVLWNIDIVRSAVADRIETSDEGLTRVFIKKVTDSLTVNEISMILSGLLILFAAMAFIAFMLPVLKPLIRGVSVLVVLVFLAAAVLFGFKWTEVKDPRVVILDKEVEARYGPSKKETKAFTLHEGAEAKVMDETQDWFYVALENKSSGWVPKTSCEII